MMPPTLIRTASAQRTVAFSSKVRDNAARSDAPKRAPYGVAGMQRHRDKICGWNAMALLLFSTHR